MNLKVKLLILFTLACETENSQNLTCMRSNVERNVTVCNTELNPGTTVQTAYLNHEKVWHATLQHSFSVFMPSTFGDCKELARILISSDKFVPGLPYISIPDPSELYSMFLIDLYKYWDMPLDDMAFIYDGVGQDIVMTMVKSLRRVTASLIHLPTGSNIGKKMVDMVALTDTRNFVIAATSNTTNEILEEIFKRNLDIASNVWFILDLYHQNYTCIKCPRANVFVLQQFWTNNMKKLVAQLLSDVIPASGVIIDCCEDDSCFNLSRSASDFFKSEFLKMYPALNTIDVYDFDYSDTSFTKILEWKYNNTQHNFELLKKPEQETTLRLVVQHEPPFVYKSQHNGTVTFSGYMMDVVDYVFRESGIKYVLYECDGALYGDLNETSGLWSGCVSDIAYGRADMIVAVLTVTSERMAVIDYILPYFGHSGIQLLGKRDVKEIFFFLEVLSPSLWITIGSTVVASSLLLCIQERVIFTKKQKENDATNYISSFSESAWFSVTSLVFSGNTKNPKSHTAKILVAGFWGFCAFIMSAFTANMAAFLTVYRLDYTSVSITGLASQNSFKFAMPQDSSISDYFYRMMQIEESFQSIWTNLNLYSNLSVYADSPVWDNPIPLTYSTIWRRAVEINAFIGGTTDALLEIRKGNYVYLTDTVVANYLSDVNCDLEMKGSDMNGRPYGFAFRKNSRYKDVISKAFLELKHKSLIVEMKEKWWKKLDNCADNWNEGLSLTELTGYFYVIFVGIAASVISLLIENILYRIKYKASKNIKEEFLDDLKIE